MPLNLLLRSEAGAPLTAVQHDANLTDIETLFNSLEAAFGVALDADGTLKNGAVDSAAVVADAILTLAKFAPGSANIVVTAGPDGVLQSLGGAAGDILLWNASGTPDSTQLVAALVGLVKPYAARAYPAVSQNITANGTLVKVTLASTDFNQDSVFSAANSRYVAPVAGVYRFSWVIQMDNNTANAATMTVQSQLALNGAAGSGGTGCAVASPPGSRWFMAGSATLQLAANDYVELFASAGDGVGTGAVTVQPTAANTHFCGERLIAT